MNMQIGRPVVAVEVMVVQSEIEFEILGIGKKGKIYIFLTFIYIFDT